MCFTFRSQVQAKQGKRGSEKLVSKKGKENKVKGNKPDRPVASRLSFASALDTSCSSMGSPTAFSPALETDINFAAGLTGKPNVENSAEWMPSAAILKSSAITSRRRGGGRRKADRARRRD